MPAASRRKSASELGKKIRDRGGLLGPGTADSGCGQTERHRLLSQRFRTGLRMTMLGLAVLLAGGIAAQPPQPAAPICPGDLLTIQLDRHDFRVAKVLAVRPPSLFVRIYFNRWTARPASVETKQLVVGRVSDPEGYGTSCIGFAESVFLKDASPQHIGHSPVVAEELEDAEEQLRVNGLSNARDAGSRAGTCAQRPSPPAGKRSN
jgi:hypothetical protein